MGKKYSMVIKYFCCRDCKKEICHSNWRYGQKRCYSCNMKRRHKLTPLKYPSGEKAFNYKFGRYLTKNHCVDCNIEISFNHKRCRRCAMKYLFRKKTNHPRFADSRAGLEAPNWQGGISFEPYPLGWTKTFKEQIRYRDGYRCQLCGVPEIECKRKLDVHHIDYNKENIKPHNLISLCIKCHRITNGNRNYWLNYFKNKNKYVGKVLG